MKKFKVLFIIWTIAVIMNVTGCAVSATALSGTKSVQQDNAAINNMIESKDDSKPEGEIAEQTAEIVFNEWGYTYSIAGNSDSSIKTSNDKNILNNEMGDEGAAEEKAETILQWNEAQESIEENKLCWLNNDYLKAYADDISFIVSDSDAVTAQYSTPASKVEVHVFTVSEDDNKYFEFGRNYTSKIYNIHQIGEETIWQCFSYNGYDDTEYTSAVLADKNIVCEITFENCDEQFIYDTLTVY